MSETLVVVNQFFLAAEPAGLEFVAQSYEDIRIVLTNAIIDEGAVQFVYTKDEAGALPQIRTLTPSAIQENTRGDEVVVGHDHDREFSRCFRLDRISSALPTDTVEPYRG